jgi:peptidoglycan-N-acetylglucosamine deacetylase
MQSLMIRSRHWRTLGWALGASALASCSGPDLTPTVVTPPPPGAEEFTAVVPEGGHCAPSLIPKQDALLVSAEASNGEVCAETGEVARYSPVRPLGVGYDEGAPDLLPPGVAYLTFDDGPSEWTNDFLDILRDKGVKSTFFITAKQLKGERGLDESYVDERGATVVYRDVLKRIVDEGHGLANHTVNHPDLAGITREQITSEIEQNELLINRALVRAGARRYVLGLFRPPYGSPWHMGLTSGAEPLPSERISSHGLNIMWTTTSTDAQDWAEGEGYSRYSEPVRDENPPTYDVKKERVKNAVLGTDRVAAGEGIIVLMHDTHNATRDVLVEIIDGLALAGYSFEPVEHYVEWRWGRPSIDLTPGPALYQPCVDDRNWGCLADGVPVGTDRAREVCGRMWLAYQALGGQGELGGPIAVPETSADTGIVSQRFERAIIELHPENPAPCNFIAIPQ